MIRIARAATLAIFLAAAGSAASNGNGPAQQPTPQKTEPAAQAKERDRQQPVLSAQTTPNCSGRPTARCAKKGGVKKLRTIF